MIVETWSDSQSPVLILRDYDSGVVCDSTLQTCSFEEKKQFLQDHGQPLDTLRKSILEEKAKRAVTINPIRLQSFLESRGERASLSKVKTIDFSQFQTHTQAIFNELTFIGSSVAQGFIAFYGIELAGIVQSYERKLRVIEEASLVTGKKASYISKIVDGHVTHLSPRLESVESAEELLSHFQESQKAKRQNVTDFPSVALTQRKEE